MIAIPLSTLLIVIVASVLGAGAWWLATLTKRINPAVCLWIALLVFGAVLVFGKIT